MRKTEFQCCFYGFYRISYWLSLYLDFIFNYIFKGADKINGQWIKSNIIIAALQVRYKKRICKLVTVKVYIAIVLNIFQFLFCEQPMIIYRMIIYQAVILCLANFSIYTAINDTKRLLNKQQNLLGMKVQTYEDLQYRPTSMQRAKSTKAEILHLLSLKKCIFEYQNTVDQIQQTALVQNSSTIPQNDEQAVKKKKQRRKFKSKHTTEARMDQKKKMQSQRSIRKREAIQNTKKQLLRGSSQFVFFKEKIFLELNKKKIKPNCNSIQFQTASQKRNETLAHKKARTLSHFNNTTEEPQEQRNAQIKLKSFMGNYRSKYRCQIPKPRESDFQHKKIEQIISQLTREDKQEENQKQAKENQQVPAKIERRPKTAVLNLKPSNPAVKKLVKEQKVKKGYLLKQRYEIIQKIGKGLSGDVFKGKDILSEKFVAIKISQNHNQKQRQYEFYKKVQHKNIITYLNNFVQNGKRYLVLQYFPHTLQSISKHRKLTQEEIKKVFKQIVSALTFLHGLSITHRDIKLENIVCNQDLTVVKFIDFGLCKDLNQQTGTMSKQFCGTIHYMPPEILEKKAYNPKNADIWSLGILLYKLSFDRFPFRGKDESQILDKIYRTKLVFPSYVNAELKNLIGLMLSKNPLERASITDVIQHRWLI